MHYVIGCRLSRSQLIVTKSSDIRPLASARGLMPFLFCSMVRITFSFASHEQGSGMVLTYGTVEGIDLQVAKGIAIGYFGIDDDLSKIPKLVGDWSLRTVPDNHRHGVGMIVAVPTNRRTRKIYNKGRIAWLKALGFTEERAWLYFKASQTNKRKWDHRVANFVDTNFNLDPFIIADIIASESPRRTCMDNGIYTTMHNGQVIAGCEILSAIHKC